LDKQKRHRKTGAILWKQNIRKFSENNLISLAQCGELGIGQAHLDVSRIENTHPRGRTPHLTQPQSLCLDMNTLTIYTDIQYINRCQLAQLTSCDLLDIIIFSNITIFILIN
jgi:hypothetical protein